MLLRGMYAARQEMPGAAGDGIGVDTRPCYYVPPVLSQWTAL
jgi:hypothetical protein